LAKKATKKVAKKKAKKADILKKVPKQYCFIVVDGKNVESLPQLALMLDDITDEIFYHHVNDARNDFASWIRDVIGDIELADKLMGIKSKQDTQLQILKQIAKKL